MPDIDSILNSSPVIPVVAIMDPHAAVPLARALVAGGIGIIELTLRTDTALESIRAIAAEVPEILIGAGTILTPEQADEALAAGAQFLISPGATPQLLRHMIDLDVPVLPGVATVGEVMSVLEHGLHAMKFFPAEPAGGPDYLDAIGAPIPSVRFCPTGGIKSSTAAGYLRLPNVACVGGSWLTPGAAVESGNWDLVTNLAKEATELRRR